MSSQYVDGGLEQHDFDWDTFDQQPVKIKEMTWYAVASDVHYPLVIPADLAEPMAARGWRVLNERHAAMAQEAYGADYPVNVGNVSVGRGFMSLTVTKPLWEPPASPAPSVKPKQPDRSFLDLEVKEVRAPKITGLALDL